LTYLRLLRDALERLEKAPRPAEGSLRNDYESAAAHFGEGVHLFWRHSFHEAESAFENAIALNPGDPKVWYFRALARRRLGNSTGAQHDALMGAFVERSRPRDRSIDSVLSRVQGVDRFWLEGFRRGDPSQQLLQLELAGVNVRPGVSP
jgi:tetratricopeptide (TPR) repeat protein